MYEHIGEEGGKEEKSILHWPGIEPGPPAWQARILPLNHQCLKPPVLRHHFFFVSPPMSVFSPFNTSAVSQYAYLSVLVYF